MDHHHGASAHAQDHIHVFEAPAMVDLAELEGEVLAQVAEQAAARLAELCRADGVEVRRAVDIGCGPGIGSCVLARCFASADVLAVDGAAPMLERAAARAGRLGLGSRIETRLVELPAGFAAVDRADVAWASMALHHLGDEVAAMRAVRERLAPGGLFALVELGDPMRFLPDGADLGRPGLWDRLDVAWAAWFAQMRAGLPGATPSGGHAAMLTEAGFEVVADELLVLDLGPPLDAAARRLAREHLRRARRALTDHATAADLEALDALVDDHGDAGILRRPDARLRASRRLTVGRASRRSHDGR